MRMVVVFRVAPSLYGGGNRLLWQKVMIGLVFLVMIIGMGWNMVVLLPNSEGKASKHSITNNVGIIEGDDGYQIPPPNFLGRSWMQPQDRLIPPWMWTVYKTEANLKSRLLYELEINRPFSKFCSVPHAGENTTLRQRGIPFFSNRDPTIPLRNLADVLSLLTSQQQQRSETRITFLGDSTMTSLFFGAGCHLAKNNHVRVLRDRRDLEFSKGDFIEPLTSGKWQKFYVYYDALEYRNRTVQMVNVRSDWLPVATEQARRLCEDTDVLVVLLGLHYRDAQLDTSEDRQHFINNTASFMHTIRPCMEQKHTTVIWLTPAAQHFPGRPGGLFTQTMMGQEKQSCTQWQDPVEDVEWVSPILRANAAKNDINVEFVQLGKKENVNCASSSSRPTLYIIPWFDITANLHAFHKNEVSVIYDCTHHPTGMSSTYDPVWDGMFRAITARHACQQTPLQTDVIVTSDITNGETSHEYHRTISNIRKLDNKRMRKAHNSYELAKHGPQLWYSFYDFIPLFSGEKEYAS